MHRSEELLQHTGQPGVGIGKRGVQRRGLCVVRRCFAVERGRGTQLRIEIRVIHATHIGQRRAGTDEHVAVLNRAFGALHRLLARVPGGVDVGNVVAGRHQRVMASTEPRHPDIEQTHDSDLIPCAYKGVVETPAAA
ncbi:hypothetical protein D3C87_1653170 [compost metagenome]